MVCVYVCKCIEASRSIKNWIYNEKKVVKNERIQKRKRRREDVTLNYNIGRKKPAQ